MTHTADDMHDDSPATPISAEAVAGLVPRYKLVGYDSGIEPAHDGGLVSYGDYLALTAEVKALKRERDEARSIVRDIHWMAVRYADNRKSYAVGMCNDAIRKAYDGGWLIHEECGQHDLDPQYARDGMFDTEWKSAVASAEARADSLASELAQCREALGWIDAWVSNPVGSYSVHALDGLFAMTRDRIAALPPPPVTKETQP